MRCCKYDSRISKLSVVTRIVTDVDCTIFIVMLSVSMLGISMLSVSMLSVSMPSVSMLSVIMLGDVPPFS